MGLPRMREISRATRVEMYADWLMHDADGLTFNLMSAPAIDGATAILAVARAKLMNALELVDRAIAADNVREHADV